MIEQLLAEHPVVLSEFAVTEPLSRLPGIKLHPDLFLTPFIYGPEDSKVKMEGIYRSYLEVAESAGLPMLLTAPTWRLDAERVARADVPRSINRDAVEFLIDFRDRVGVKVPVSVGALMGPKNDCYSPDLAPSAEDAESFHQAQASELAETDAEFILVQTLPAVSEAIGIARVLSRIGKPYIISYCTGVDGLVLDGTRLPEAFEAIDGDVEVVHKPVGFSVNCTYPSFHFEQYPDGSLDRLIAIQANGSSKDVCDLESSSQTVNDPVPEWTESMLEFHRRYGVPVLGGCCGTSAAHMQMLAESLRK